MIVHEVAQGSANWYDLRLGMPTASCMDRILSASVNWYLVDEDGVEVSRHTRKHTAEKALAVRRKRAGNGVVVSRFDPSAQHEGYISHLLAEWALGSPIESYQSREMERGQDLEPEARAWYEMHTDIATEDGGFITDDDATMGCSPDFRVYDGDTLIGCGEIKNPVAQTHMSYARGVKRVEGVYKHQVQAGLLITGAQWWDVLSYFPHPRLKPVLIRVLPEHDAEYRLALKSALGTFCEKLKSERERMSAEGYGPKTREGK